MLAVVLRYADWGLHAGRLRALLLRPRLVIPSERLISVGEPGDAMYFISSGVVEVLAGGQRFLLSRGDFFGEMALVHDQSRQADVNALSYCQLLALDRRDFAALLRTSRAIRARIDHAAREREIINRAEGKGQRAEGREEGKGNREKERNVQA